MRCSSRSPPPGTPRSAATLRAPLVVFAGAAGLLALTRAVGLAVFALLPNQLDQRGPAVMLRALLSFALVAPPVDRRRARRRARTARRSSPATLAGTAAAVAEAALLIVFAAWRLAGRVDRLGARLAPLGASPSPGRATVSSVRLRELVLRSSCLRWNVAVEPEIDSDSPISVLDAPRSTSPSTWPSRRLRP